MKRTWELDELIDHWTLLPVERTLIEDACDVGELVPGHPRAMVGGANAGRLCA